MTSHQPIVKTLDAQSNDSNSQPPALADTNADAIGRLTIRLKVAFMMLTCLGGLVLEAGPESSFISVIAVFFAIFGFVFVDCLKLFALPPVAAYAGMLLAAMYCVGRFLDNAHAPIQQLVTVAQLLVLVQAIMMLQRKTRRVFEQLGIFCLLELLVAGVYNNALNYGLLLIAICLVGAWAMSMLSAIATSEGIANCELLSRDENTLSFFARAPNVPTIKVSSSNSASGISQVGVRLPQVALFALAPATLLVGLVFFYALPRTVEANRASSSAGALVGFSDTMTLDQIGQMSFNNDIAARIELRDSVTKEPYRVFGCLYVRGRVLEEYIPVRRKDRYTANWNSFTPPLTEMSARVPDEFFADGNDADGNDVDKEGAAGAYDRVSMRVTCESSWSPTLFTLAPYYGTPAEYGSFIGSGAREELFQHDPARWVLNWADTSRRFYSRVTYQLGTHSLRQGRQAEVMGDWDLAALPEAKSSSNQLDHQPDTGDRDSAATQKRIPPTRAQQAYYRRLLEFDRQAMPTIAATAEKLSVDALGRPNNRLATAFACHRWLSNSQRFEYSLNLNAKPIAGMDAIEKFVKVDRRGHCQYFASALAMMLRSQGIPARLVVGYCSDEFNGLNEQHVIRQSHAHAWVEGLFDVSELVAAGRTLPAGEPPTEKVWLRLDATPVSRVGRVDEGNVRETLDFAQSTWDDFLVDMNAEKQNQLLPPGSVGDAMAESYGRFVRSMTLLINSIRAGDLGGGAWARGGVGFLPVVFVGMTIVGTTLYVIRGSLIRRKRAKEKQLEEETVPVPSIGFYAQALKQLGRAGIYRGRAQTPRELASEASDQLDHPLVPPIGVAMGRLTEAYYRIRFGTPAVAKNVVGNNVQASSELASSRQVTDVLAIDAVVENQGWEPEVVDALAELSHSIDLITIEDSPQ